MPIAIRLILLPLLLIFCSFSLINKEDSDVKQGNVIYKFKTGKIQCQSEIDAAGQIAILYKSLKNNTTIEFVRVGVEANPKTKVREEVIVFVIRVKEENPICLSWTDIQEITIVIDPLPVNEISLSGKTIFRSGKIHVLTPS